MSRAAARQDMARPSVESVLAPAVSWGSGGSGRLGLAGEGTTGGVAAPLLTLTLGPLLATLLAPLLAPLLTLLLAPLLGPLLALLLAGAAVAPALTRPGSGSLLTELVDLLDSCLIRVPDSRGSVNWVVL